MKKGLIIAKRDSINKKNVPVMVIVIDGLAITAIGDPDSNWGSIAEDHHAKAADMDAALKESFAQDLYDHYAGYAGGAESGTATKIVNYEGAGKKEVDKIKHDFMNRRVDRFLQKKRNADG